MGRVADFVIRFRVAIIAVFAAMALYRHLGYRVVPNYGPYEDMPDSVYMKKKL